MTTWEAPGCQLIKVPGGEMKSRDRLTQNPAPRTGAGNLRRIREEVAATVGDRKRAI